MMTCHVTVRVLPSASQVACPIVFGSIAFWMGKKAAEHASHRWTLFVRGPNDEDLSCFVSKIIFSLHPSFSVPLRGKVLVLRVHLTLRPIASLHVARTET